MSIKFLPTKLLARMAPKATVEKLVTDDLTLNRAALNALTRLDGIKKKTLEETALKVIKGYRARYGDERDSGATAAEAFDEAVNGKKQMVQRVHNAVVYELGKRVKREYHGEYAKWLPSSAVEPRPEHQLNYGKTFQIGKGINGIQPGDEYGCQCGMEILVNEEKLDI